MAAQAFESIYVDEFIRGFELRQSLLRDAVATEVMIKGRDATFLIARANRSAVTRGPNGLIPANLDDLNQVTVTMREAHDLTQRTGFNLFTGQANQRRIMQETGMIVINQEIDDTILTALSTATVGITQTEFNKVAVNKALTRLFNGQVPNDGQVYGLLSPASWMTLSDTPTFASRDYVDGRPVQNGPDRPGTWKEWMGVKWTMHPRLVGVGTGSAVQYIWHKTAIGHAVDTAGIQAKIGVNDEQDYSYARHTIYHGAKVLQNAGIVKITTSDSALSTA